MDSDSEPSTPKPPMTLEVPAAPAPRSALSPETPSSTFGRTVLQESRRCVVLAIVLCYWDNILGPRIRHLWHVESLDHLINLDLLSYIANHTLSGEICRDPGDSQVDSKFYVLKEKDLVVTSFIFSALGKGDFGVHSLSVIVGHKDMGVYLNWQPLTMSWMQRGVTKLRILLDKFSETQAVSKFTPFLSEFLSMFSSIREAPVSHNISLLDTAFHPTHQFDGAFVHRVILSHLTTCGRSVVIGNAPAKINLMIATLALFLRRSERACCRYVTADRPWAYHPDLCVQGLLIMSGDTLGPTLRAIYHSQYPSTLVDLSGGEVRVSALPHQHRVLRHDALIQDLRALWRDEDTVYPTQDMFHTVDDPDTLVTNFLHLMEQLPLSGGHRESLVHKFIHLLEKKAFTLIKYIETHSQKGKYCLRDQIKKIRSDLSLTVTGDFNIVMATAERLKPQVYSVVYGEPVMARQNGTESRDV